MQIRSVKIMTQFWLTFKEGRQLYVITPKTHVARNDEIFLKSLLNIQKCQEMLIVDENQFITANGIHSSIFFPIMSAFLMAM